LEKVKSKWNIKTFETRSKFFLAGMKEKWDEDGGRVLLGDNIGLRGGGGRSCCGRLGSDVLEFGFRLDCRDICLPEQDNSLAPLQTDVPWNL
jgi:hypothetical protein